MDFFLIIQLETWINFFITKLGMVFLEYNNPTYIKKNRI